MRRRRSSGEPDGAYYRVGGASVAVVSADLPLAGETEPDYLPFLDRAGGAGGGGAGADLRVDLLLGEPSLPAGARMVLEAGDAWSMHALGERLLAVPQIAPAATRPGWMALIEADRHRVRVTCGGSLVSGAGPRRLLESPVHYPLDQILLSLALAGEGVIVHAAGVDLGPGGVLLCGASGAGKTTIARLCAAASRPVLSDDRVIVRRSANGWRLFGTPWPGEGRFAENRGIPLLAVVFLVKGGENRLQPLAAADLARRFLPLASIPWYDPGAAERCLDLTADLAAEVKSWELTFLPESGVVPLLERLSG